MRSRPLGGLDPHLGPFHAGDLHPAQLHGQHTPDWVADLPLKWTGHICLPLSHGWLGGREEKGALGATATTVATPKRCCYGRRSKGEGESAEYVHCELDYVARLFCYSLLYSIHISKQTRGV